MRNSPTEQWLHFAHLRPLLANLFDLLEDELVLLHSPSSSVDVRVNHVVPALPALSAEPVRQKASNDDPVLSAVLLHILLQNLVLLLAPLGRVLQSLNRTAHIEVGELIRRPVLLIFVYIAAWILVDELE